MKGNLASVSAFLRVATGILIVVTSAPAASRSSASYSVPAESIGAAGSGVQSGSYTFEGSALCEFGAADNPAPASAGYVTKPGYVGELYNIVALSVTAPPSSSLNEGTTRQLNAAPLADDGTTNALIAPSTVTWSIVSGPIASITTAGVATAGTVYQDTAAAVGGVAQGLSGQLNLTILNVSTDDFGAYANDGIDDSWQVQYFGQPPNALAGPNVDADGTGQTNLFKFVAGLNPLDGSRFTLSIQTVIGQPTKRNVIFQPLVSGRTYSVQFKTSLTTPSWQALTGTTQVDNGNTRTVTDTSAVAPKYYHVQISKP